MIKLRAREHAKSCTLCFLSIIIATVFISSSAFSSLAQNVVIQSTGTIGSLSVVYATSGSPAVIQAAVNAVNSAGGGTVYIPAGTFHWNGQTVTIPGGVNIIGASPAGNKGHEYNWEEYAATTILHNDAVPTDSYELPTMFEVNGNNGKATRISGIRFETPGVSSPNTDFGEQNEFAILLIGAKNFRVDHCTFINFAGTAIKSTSASWDGATGDHSAYGLVDHIVIDNPYKLNYNPEGWAGGYGVYAHGSMKSATNYVDEIAPFAGKFEAIKDTSIMYVEDSKFSKPRHAIDSYCGGAITVRFNLFAEPFSYYGQGNNIGEIDQHGGFSPSSDGGGVLLDAYNNTIMGKNGLSTWAYRIRGGHGLFYNNLFNPPASGGGILVTLDAEVDKVNNMYIWNNQYSSSTFIDNNGGYIENVDYFLRAPSQALDGWTYTPYPYPHPLVAG